LREKIDEQNGIKRMFRDDISDMLQSINDYKNLKKAIVGMYKKYVATKDGQKTDKAGGNSDLHKESTQQRTYLENSLNNVTQKLIKSQESFE